MDQELLQRTIGDGERHESLTTTKTMWERKRVESSDKDNEPTPRTIRAFDEKPRKEDENSSSVDYQLRARKPSNPKTSNNNIERNTTNQKRRKCQSTSNSDSEGQEENEKIIGFQRKGSNLEEKKESPMTRSQSNGADQNSRSVTREYEVDSKTCRSLTGEEEISHKGRSNDLEKLDRRHREYAEADKDFIAGSRHCLKEDKSHTNSDSSDSDGEQEAKRSAREGQGGVKRQGTPVGDTDRQQRSRSGSTGSSDEKNRKSRHHHHHHRHRRHHHRHHRNRSSTPSENRAEKRKRR